MSEGKNVAFFCSQSCPGDIIIKTQDWANARGPESVPVIGGFHTPVERDVLRILVRRRAPVVLVLGRALEGWRAPLALRPAIEAGSVQLLSPFAPSQRRTTAETALVRSRHILSLCRMALIAHASPGGKTEQLVSEALDRGLDVVTFPSKHNSNLLKLGASQLTP